MWDGKEGFDFLGMHHRRMTTETSKGQLYKETYQYPSRKAMKKIESRNQKECKQPKSAGSKRGRFNKESEPENHRVEELLFYQDKRKVDADARLVHYLYFYKMV